MSGDNELLGHPAESGVMPRVPQLRGRTPRKVLDAIEVFSSELRVRLIRHYFEHPGSQVAAAEALGVPAPTVTRNTQRLVRLRVVQAYYLQPDLVEDGRRARSYRVNLARYEELILALQEYVSRAGSER